MNEQEHLVIDNLGIAKKCANRWSKRDIGNIEFDDLFQEACIGLIRASRTYSPDGKANFSTYAHMAMNAAIVDMRFRYYTGSGDYAGRPGRRWRREKYSLPKWILLDHPPPTFDDDNDPWFDKFVKPNFNNFALREEIRRADITIEGLMKCERKRQKLTYDFIFDTKAFMKENGIHHAHLAEKIGVRQDTVSRWLSGDRKISLEARKKIDTALYGSHNYEDLEPQEEYIARVKKIMDEKGITVTQLTKMMGLKGTIVRHWFNGRSNMSVERREQVDETLEGI